METAPSSTPAAPAAPPAAPPPAPDAKPAPSDAGGAASPAADATPKHKVKIDGEEKEVTLDELLKGYQTEAAAQKRLKEVAEERKTLAAEREKAGKVVAAAKAGDYSALRDLGLSDDEIEQVAIKALSAKQQAKLEEERRKALDPEQRELEDLRREKEERTKAEKTKAETEQQQKVQGVKQQVTGSVIGTLDLLPEQMRKSGVVANRVLEAWEYALEHEEEITKRGIKVTPEFIAEKVKGEIREMYRSLLAGTKDEDLDAWVPEDVWGRRKPPAADPAKPAQKGEPAAHPALGGKAVVRDAATKAERKPRKTDAQVMREATLGKRP